MILSTGAPGRASRSRPSPGPRGAHLHTRNVFGGFAENVFGMSLDRPKMSPVKWVRKKMCLECLMDTFFSAENVFGTYQVDIFGRKISQSDIFSPKMCP